MVTSGYAPKYAAANSNAKGNQPNSAHTHPCPAPFGMMFFQHFLSARSSRRMAAICGSTFTSNGWKVRGKSRWRVVNNVRQRKLAGTRSEENGTFSSEGSRTLSKMTNEFGMRIQIIPCLARGFVTGSIPVRHFQFLGKVGELDQERVDGIQPKIFRWDNRRDACGGIPPPVEFYRSRQVPQAPLGESPR